MNRSTYEIMEDQVRAIYRALTGREPLEHEVGGAPSQATPSTPAESRQEVERRFAELEAAARLVPTVAERVPPFAFAPPVDVVDLDRELVVEAAVPGVERDDVQAELRGDMLILSGVRPGERLVNGRTYLHAEIPRGPFRRVVLLPYALAGPPRIEAAQGIVRVHLAKPSKG